MDTPKHWAEYLKYIKDHNAREKAKLDKKKKKDVAAYKALPWRERIFTNNPLEWNSYWHPPLEPSLIDYFSWELKRNKRSVK